MFADIEEIKYVNRKTIVYYVEISIKIKYLYEGALKKNTD